MPHHRLPRGVCKHNIREKIDHSKSGEVLARTRLVDLLKKRFTHRSKSRHIQINSDQKGTDQRRVRVRMRVCNSFAVLDAVPLICLVIFVRKISPVYRLNCLVFGACESDHIFLFFL